MAIEKTKLTSACFQLRVAPLEDEDYGFLREYHSVMKLIAIALKSIESDSYTFALYLPTLFGLRINLQAMIDGHKIFHCEPLVVALLKGLDARFGNLMDPFSSDGKSVPLFVAMISNPTFKLNFMGMKKIQPHLLNRWKDMLLAEALKVENVILNDEDGGDDMTQTHTLVDTKINTTNELLIENDICIGEPLDQKARVLNEINQYLSTKVNVNLVDGLKGFPIIRKLFLKFNCIRSSEAVCERMFSYAGELPI